MAFRGNLMVIQVKSAGQGTSRLEESEALLPCAQKPAIARYP